MPPVPEAARLGGAQAQRGRDELARAGVPEDPGRGRVTEGGSQGQTALPDIEEPEIDPEAVGAKTVPEPLPDVLEIPAYREPWADVASIAEKESRVVIAVEDEPALVHGEKIFGVIEFPVVVRVVGEAQAARVRDVVHSQTHQGDRDRLAGFPDGADRHDVGEEVVLHDGTELLGVHVGQLAVRERREPGGIPVGRGPVIGEPDEGAAHAEGPGPDPDAEELPRVAGGPRGAGQGGRTGDRQGDVKTEFRSGDEPHQIPPPRDSRAMGENDG